MSHAILDLLHKKVALVDKKDLKSLSKYKWHVNSMGYVCFHRSNKGKPMTTLLHRVVMNAPKGVCVDHINSDKLDNRRENLRLCTQSQNLANQRVQIKSKSGHKGVCWHKTRERWRAYIHFENKWKYLGLYLDKKEAAKAYNEAAQQYFGEFAKLNII